jgi:hypothetical protein
MTANSLPGLQGLPGPIPGGGYSALINSGRPNDPGRALRSQAFLEIGAALRPVSWEPAGIRTLRYAPSVAR